MKEKKIEDIPTKIHLFDGYQCESFWKDSVHSTYYDYQVDKQCRIPIRSIEQVKRELGLIK